MAALRWLYTVAAGFAVIQSVRTFALDADERVDFQFTGDLIVFIVFMSVVVRFSHGAIRHFYMSYDEREEGWLWHEPLADFTGLFLEAFFFLMMALALKDHSQFAVYYFCLLAVDTLWLSFIPANGNPYKNWLVANSLFFLITIPVFLVCRGQDAVFVGFLAAATAIHHVLDYISPGNWHYYFDGVPKPALIDWIEQHLGGAFLKVGNLLWAVIILQPLRERLGNRRRGAQ